MEASQSLNYHGRLKIQRKTGKARETEKKFFNVLLVNEFFDIGFDRRSQTTTRRINLRLHLHPSVWRDIFHTSSYWFIELSKFHYH